jgi:HlyD family secretion protein
VEPAAVTVVSPLGVEEQRVDVVVGLADAPAGLGDGYRVEAHLEVARRDHVLVVPETAVYRRGGAMAVFVDEGGRARERTLSLGLRDGTWAEVVAGLEAGDAVVLHPSEALRDGVRVRAFEANR